MGVGWHASLSDLSRFMRVETGLFASGIAVSGFLVFSPPGSMILPITAASMLSSASIYSYNHLKDLKEDSVNTGINPLANSRAGRTIPLITGMLALAAAASLSFWSFLLCAAALALSLAYSAARVKSVLFIKNLYTGAVLSMVFLMGAFATGRPGPEALGYAPVPFLLGFCLNLLGDIRGLKGDRAAGLRTLPVLLGRRRAELVLQAVLWASVIAIMSVYPAFASLAVFMALLSVFLARGDMKLTRACMLMSFSTLPFAVFVILWM